MKFFMPEQLRCLTANGRWNKERRRLNQTPSDFRPIVRLFLLGTPFQWLLSEIDPENLMVAFGLADLGHGIPETGFVSLDYLGEVRGPDHEKVEVDHRFRAGRSISAYANEARLFGRILM